MNILPAASAFLLMLAAPAAAQQDGSGPGTIAFPAAGTAFPDHLAGLTRRRAVPASSSPNDWVASYAPPTGPLRPAISLNIHQIAPEDRLATSRATCEVHNNVALGIIRDQSGAQIRSFGAATTTRGAASYWRILFDTREDGRIVHRERHIYCELPGHWEVQYDVYTPDGMNLAPVLSTFVQAGPWPGRALTATASPR
jgi:hypothetical protein